MRLLLSASVLGVAGGGFGSAALAQGAESLSTIEEVVVTARKREESLQSVPVAVSSVSGQALEQQSIRQPTDLSRTVPSLTISNSAGTVNNASISLRGQVAGDVLLNVSQPVGLYIDSVNVPHPVGANGSFFDLSRIEVLKGPQGTLYGRNTTGGAINIITRAPDFAGLHGFVQAEYGNYESLRFGGAINVPLMDDKAAMRVAYQSWDREGYGRSRITGQKLGGDRDDEVARISFLVTPTSYFSADLKFEYLRADRNGDLATARAYNGNVQTAIEVATNTNFATYQPLAFAGLALGNLTALGQTIAAGQATLAPCINDDLFTSCQGTRTFDNVEAKHGVLDLNWDITENIRLRSISGYHWFENDRLFDLDATPYQLLEVGAGVGGGLQPFLGTAPQPWPTYPYGYRPDQYSTQLSQEFNLAGDTWDGRFNWLVGAFWADDQGAGSQQFVAFPTLQRAAFPGGQGGIVGAAYNANEVANRTWALFTQNDIKFSDKVSVTLGARYTEERLQQTLAAWQYNTRSNAFTCLAGPFAATATAAATPVVNGDQCNASSNAKFSGTSYLGSLNLQLTESMLLYFKTARGFRGGALQGRAPDQPPVAPEIATDYEIGFKSDFFDRRLRTNFAVYQTNYTNKQEQVITLNALGSTTTILRNAAEARLRGAELEVLAVPLEGLTLRGSATYLDAQYLSYPGALTPQSVPATPCTTCIDASGVQIAQPQYRFDVGARYEFAVGPGSLALQADYAWRDKTPITKLTRDTAIPLAIQQEFNEAHGLLNARVEYLLPDMGLTFGAFATNLTDERYQRISISPANAGGVTAGLTAEPRMYGVSVRKTFGDE